MRSLKILSFDRVESTMFEARKILETRPSETPLALLAGMQTRGIGRRGRPWISDPGNLSASLILPLPSQSEVLPFLSFAVAIALREILATYLPKTTRLGCKWPNDLLIERKKVGGVLIEVDPQAVIIGVGVNLTSYPPTDVRTPATAVSEHAQTAPPPEVFLKAFYERFVPLLNLLEEEGFEPLRRMWLAHAEGRNEEVIIEVGGGQPPLRGCFIDLDNQGGLVVQPDSRRLQTVYAGDVSLTLAAPVDRE